MNEEIPISHTGTGCAITTTFKFEKYHLPCKISIYVSSLLSQRYREGGQNDSGGEHLNQQKLKTHYRTIFAHCQLAGHLKDR